MQLDNTQPWMRNRSMKAHILLAGKPMNNPVMRAYQQEFEGLRLVPKDPTNDLDTLMANLERAAEAYRNETDSEQATRDSVAVRWQALSDARLALTRLLGHVPERTAGIWF